MAKNKSKVVHGKFGHMTVTLDAATGKVRYYGALLSDKGAYFLSESTIERVEFDRVVEEVRGWVTK